MNLAAFRVRFPEFETAGDSFVQAALDSAALETDAKLLGGFYDEAHGLLAAHKLAMSPYGMNARLVNDDGKTTYELVRMGVLARAVPGVTVAGGV